MLFYLQTLTNVESQISSGNLETCQREAVSDSPERKNVYDNNRGCFDKCYQSTQLSTMYMLQLIFGFS